ncbi:DUF4176 domain-containing protein [Clostridium sporogenes]|uniref:DUF4176 domain-containing protein n=1 Tax=Clostridium sporogenes TaxID=1509 RepID=UPI0006B26D29|nr:DUF4176 domain-containing protein [Clostridium sporogenes]KOY65495.1 hypothetical protein AN649_13560 [Clostridium sporogenes]MDS1006563.1 DUF4176 domain-containing protein [Clostridium sporogenes]
MKEILLNIGSIVEVEHQGEIKNYLIVGKRVINFNSMKAWDYYSVPYPEGIKKDREGRDDNGFYFNHPEIENITYTCNIEIGNEE